MATLQQMERELEEKRGELNKLFVEHKKDGQYDFTVDQLSEVNKRNDELTDLGKSYEAAKKLADIDRKNAEILEARAQSGAPVHDRPKGRDPGHLGEESKNAPWAFDGNVMVREGKSFGQLLQESDAFQKKSGGSGPVARFDDLSVKTLFSSGAGGGAAAGWQAQSLRTGKVVLSPQEMPRVADVIPMTETQFPVVKYMEESTFTNNAAETAESVQATAGTYPESALQLTERSSLVQKIATFLPVTDEQLEDVPQVRGYIDNRLPFMLRQRLDGQIVAGDGTGSNLLGILGYTGGAAAVGNIQSQAKGADPTPDAIYKAMTLIRVNGKAYADAVLFHPNDWQDIRLLRTSTGLYIWGNPSEAGPERIWALPVIQSTFVTENTAIVGDFAEYSELSMRRGIEVQISNSHSTFFIEGKQAIRADFRCAFFLYRPSAFCEVTGI